MRIEVDKKYFVLAIILGLSIAGLVVGFAYAGSSGVGHNINNVGCGADFAASCDANSDGIIDNAASISWSGITEIPAGFADGTDDGGCRLYQNVHSKVCPAGKYVMKYNFRSGTDCFSFVNYQCSKAYLNDPGTCPHSEDILNNISFGYLAGTLQKICRATDTYSNYKGDVLCC